MAEELNGHSDGASKHSNGTFIARTDPIAESPPTADTIKPAPSINIRHGKVQRLGDFDDTDALSPAESLTGPMIPEALGKFCLIHTHPDFRQRVREEYNIIVAGKAFGCGSSRETAVSACSEQECSFLGITITEPRFYDLAVDGAKVTVDLEKSSVTVESLSGDTETFGFQLSRMERQLIECGGLTKAFETWGKTLWQALHSEAKPAAAASKLDSAIHPGHEKLQW